MALDLFGISTGVIGLVNPQIPATLRRSTGYTTNEDGTRIPTYEEVNLSIQVQALSNDELRLVEGLGIQGNKTAVYISGNWNGVVRAAQKGGDMLIFNNSTWLAVTVLENWPKWTKLACVMQND